MNIPYARQTITESDIDAVVDVLRSPMITQGPILPVFEKAIAKRVGVKFAIGVNSATSALHIACLALGLGEGDLLWTTPITFVASANCARYCGADVDFVDIDRSTGLMSVSALADKLIIAKEKNKLPKVVVPVHLAGTSCDMEAIAELASQYGFLVVEDASHAIGGRYKEKCVGGCHYSDITVFSFHPAKIITTGEGGMALTNDSETARRLYELRSHGITKEKDQFKLSCPGPWAYEQQTLGFNYRMNELQAALGLSQLKRLDSIVEERNLQLGFYQELLADLPLNLLEVPTTTLSSGHLAVVRFEHSTPDLHKSVFEDLRAAGIGVQLHYTPVHLQPYYRSLGFSEGQFPESERYSVSAFSLPIFPGLSQNDQIHVVELLLDSLKAYRSRCKR